ncbi:MAG TPA: EAL domain-containing protein, partial [Chloroflexota bacterium]|nr:EAL domain-containing protein [Chloroflexota bacterium]
MGLIARFSIVGVTVSVLVAGSLAAFIETQVSTVLLANIAARAADQVDHLGLTGYVTVADFSAPHAPEQLASVAERLNPIFNDIRADGTGVIRLQMFATDGTILYSDLPTKRGEVVDLANEPSLVTALNGQSVHDVSDLEGPENNELRAQYGQALEVYIPVDIQGQVVGAYEIYQDLGPALAVRPVVWGGVLGGFALLLVALLGVVQTAAVLIRRQQQTLAHHAFHDVLTSLPNRALFLDRVSQALRRKKQQPAVLIVDIDGLKLVNDSLGHDVGDQLLLAVAGRLRDCLAPGDTAARLGSDEFGILLEDVPDVTAAIASAKSMLAALRVPVAIDGQELLPTVTIGIALSAAETPSAETLVLEADQALARAKRRSKDCFEVFNNTMANHAPVRLALETDLRRAVERHELRLYYQPVLSLTDGRIVEVEALVRWQHPERGLVQPMSFIPVAEETGLIVAIGQWVLEESCRQAAEWRSRLGAFAPTVAVNLSARQLQRPELLFDVRQALRTAQLEPSSLKLELTESVIMQDAEATDTTLHALKALGIGLAIDDFGTGYSSLAYLKRFPVDTLKIDRSFVDGLGTDPQDTAIVQSIVALAQALGLSVTGEGVETTGQRDGLKSLGCDRAQGFLFARPCPAYDLE